MNWKELPVGTIVMWSKTVWDSDPLAHYEPVLAYVCHYGKELPTICLSQDFNDTKNHKIVGDKSLPYNTDIIAPLEIKEDITEWL